MTAMLPSPRMVAPETPRTAAIWGPTDFTTTSRLPSISSATSALECSPARTRMTGTGAPPSAMCAGAVPSNTPRCLNW